MSPCEAAATELNDISDHSSHRSNSNSISSSSCSSGTSATAVSSQAEEDPPPHKYTLPHKYTPPQEGEPLSDHFNTSPQHQLSSSSTCGDDDNTSSESARQAAYLPQVHFAAESAADSKFTGLLLSLFGFRRGKWKRVFLFHVVLTVLINGYSVAIATYSAFGANPSTAVDDAIAKMQQVLTQEVGSGSNDTITQLAELRKWEDFNRWIVSCAAYAKHDITSGRCKGALESFDQPPPYLPSDSPHNLEKRELRELALNLRKACSPTLQVPTLEAHDGLLTTLLIASCIYLASLLVLVVFGKRAARVVFYLKTDSKKREKAIPVSEEKDANYSANHIQPVLIKPSAVTSANLGSARNRKETSRQLESTDIWTAASQGDAVAVESLFLQHRVPDINDVHPKFGTPLQAAAESGKTKLVEKLLKRKPDPNVTGGRLHSPLQAGAYSGNLEIVKALLNRHAIVDAYGGLCGSPLHAAAERGTSAMVQCLLHANADPNMRGGPYCFPLHAAAFRGNKDMVRSLLDCGAKVNAKGEQYSSAVHAAAVGRHVAVIRLLLEAGADVNVISETYGSPLQVACREGYAELASLLVEHNADISVLDRENRTPLHDAARGGHEALAKALLSRGIDPDSPDVDGLTALHHATSNGHAKVVKLLLDHNANVCAEDKFKAHALFRAAGMHNSTITALLLAAGSPPDARDCFGRTALHGPAGDDDVTVQRLLLEHGADINIVGDDKKTALHEAANVGNLANVKLLLSWDGIKTSLQDNDQKTPLNRALDHIHLDPATGAPETAHEAIAFLLLDAPHVDINARAGSALQEAIVRNRLALVQKMLDGGASVQVQGGKYGGVVQAAVRSGNLDMLALLLGQRANVNLQGGEFGTALQAAAFLGRTEMVTLLLEHGANVNAKGGRWGSVLHAARRSAAKAKVREEVLRLLENHDAEDVPVVTHERDDWKLSPGGWHWARPESWENVDRLVEKSAV